LWRVFRFKAGQLEKPPRLLGGLAEVTKPKAMPNDIQEIAMLAGRGIGELAGGTLRGVLEPHEHRAARCIVDIAHQPVTPFALSVGKVMTAHRLGLAREAMRQFGGVAAHYVASRSAMRSIG
jgi:hypothetical protein